MKSLVIVSVILLFLCGCAQKNESRAFRLFNEGVTLSLQASNEQDKGNPGRATVLNKQAIEKFEETLKTDSGHLIARSALAHCLYLDKQFAKAIKWFEQANIKAGATAVNMREMGLCNINLGQFAAGRADIDQAFLLDTTMEIRNITVDDLTDIGRLAFKYGGVFEVEGDLAKGRSYKEFAAGVVLVAYDYDRSRKSTANMLDSIFTNLGDDKMAVKYRLLGE